MSKLFLSKPLVSVIMPARNAEKYIASAVSSVVSQSYVDWELIIVDDGSEDNTPQIAQSFAESDKRIRYFRKRSLSLGKSRNAGINIAGGRLVAFLDSDDLWLSDKLMRQVQVLTELNADLVFSNGYLFSGDDSTNESHIFAIKWGTFQGPGWFKTLMIDNQIPVLSVLTKKSLLEKVGLFDEHPAVHGVEDYDLWLRIARSGATFYGMSDKLVRYRVHSGGMSSNLISHTEAYVTVLKKHYNSPYASVLFQRDKDFHHAVKNRLVAMQKELSKLCLHSCFALVASGRSTQALPMYFKAIRYAPRLVFSPRPFASAVRYFVLHLAPARVIASRLGRVQDKKQ